MRSYYEFVKKSAETIDRARQIEPGNFPFPPRRDHHPDSPTVLIFSPHPDDECINGGLALRLLREWDCRVVNIPVTLGSDVARRSARFEELENACRYLGFEIDLQSAGGFENISPSEHSNKTANWKSAVRRTVELIEQYDPKIVMFPHKFDRHPTHCGTNLLVTEALRTTKKDIDCFTVENEFWQAMNRPNCLIELSEEIVGDLITALSFHKGEIARNPYHLTLPSWMIDNVRRGSEVVGDAGSESQNFKFGILNRLSRCSEGEFKSIIRTGTFISMADDLSFLLADLRIYNS